MSVYISILYKACVYFIIFNIIPLSMFYSLFLGPCSKFTVHLLTLLIMSESPSMEGNETHVDVEYVSV